MLGGAGFLGSQIALCFLANGWEVGIVDGLVQGTGGNPDNCISFRHQLAFERFDCIEDIEDLSSLLKWSDLVVDAMAFTGHLLGLQRPQLDVQSNLVNHIHLIEALRQHPGKRVIYLGSRSQYGRVDSAHVQETSPCIPLDAQGINKLAAEHFFRIYSLNSGFHAISLRLTNCFGPSQRTTGEVGLVGSFILDAIEDKVIEIYGNAQRTKNLLYGNDAAKIVHMVANKSWEGFHVFNVGGVEVALDVLLETIFRAVSKGSFVVKPFPAMVKNIDVGEGTFVDDKIKGFIGNYSTTALPESISATAQYFTQTTRQRIL